MESPTLILTACMRGRQKLEYYGSLFAISDEVETTSYLSLTLMVSEYLNVLQRIALDREIEFCIDFLLCTQPVSIPLYHMAPTKLVELRKQLNELINKGFICPNS